MQAYQIVRQARDINRVSASEIIQALCGNDFIELHGGRVSSNDKAMLGGVGLVDGVGPMTIIGIQKGRNTQENIERNFGSSGPGGYRKAIRLMKQAEKFNRPVLTLINTAGAAASPDSEEEGIGEAIASSLMTMSQLTVPTLSIILGEGGSGGAIALALTDEVWMLENSVYSILSPEGFASILWKNAKFAPQAAELMKLTAPDLLDLGVIDHIIEESSSKGQYTNEKLANNISNQVKDKFLELGKIDPEKRLENRQARFRKF